MRPNILFFITDQQHADHVGYAGNRVVRTPHIDSLAAAGSWFSRFHVASSTCMSNRATFMTGRMPSLHKVRYNGVPLPLEAVTFVDLLRAGGYRTALIGKSHLQGMSTEAPRVPRRPDDGGDAPPPELAEANRSPFTAEDYGWEFRQRWEQGNRPPVPAPYYGFDEVALVVGHGDRCTGHYEDWLRAKAPELAGRRGPGAALKASATGLEKMVYQPAVGEDCYPTRYVAERMIEYLRRHAGGHDGGGSTGHAGKPFFVQCSFPDPHHPFTPPGRYWDMYDPADVELPASFFASSRDQIPPLKLLQRDFENDEPLRRWTFPFIAGEAQARECIARNYGQITFIDDAIGEILSELDRLGLRGSTIVCLMSDHGDWMGAHGLMLKGPMQYRDLVRVPMLWRDPDPAFNRGRIDALASTLDLSRTILHRAGLAPANGVQGHSLLPLLRGEADRVRDRLLLEYTTQYPYLGFDDVLAVNTLLDDRWRLSVWEGCDWGELYDLREDPEELRNLWDDPGHAGVRGDLLLRLVHEMQAHAERSPHPLSIA